MTAYITKRELQLLTQSNIYENYSNAYLDMLISTMSQLVSDYTGSTWGPQTVVDELAQFYVEPKFNRFVMVLGNGPIQSLTSATWLDAGFVQQPIDLSSAMIDRGRGLVYLRLDWAFPGYPFYVPEGTHIYVSYSSGGADVSDGVKMATALLCQEWVMADIDLRQGRPGPLTGYGLGDYHENYGTIKQSSSEFGLGTSLSQRAKTILDTLGGTGLVFLK